MDLKDLDKEDIMKAKDTVMGAVDKLKASGILTDENIEKGKKIAKDVAKDIIEKKKGEAKK